jgi:hypothetical protein
MQSPFPTAVSEVRGISSLDLDPLDTAQPDDPEHFGILIEVHVGPKGDIGAEYFGVNVCTPSWLASRVTNGEYLFPRHYLIVKRFDYETIRYALLKQFSGVMAASWKDVAERLSRWGAWEFEDYRPFEEEGGIFG